MTKHVERSSIGKPMPNGRQDGRAARVLLIAGLLTETGFLGMLWAGDLRSHIPGFLALYAVAFAGYLLAMHGVGGILGGRRPAPGAGSRRFLWLIVGFAAIFRLTLISASPHLSDDIYRYVWDGRVAAHGINPYFYPPEAAQLSHLRDATIFPHVNHAHIPTIYPPVAQFFFVGMYRLAPGTLPLRVALLLFDFSTLALLQLLLKRLSRPIEWLLIYAWNPLLVVEIAGNGHLDSFGIFLLAASLLFLFSRRPFGGAVGLALSALTKFLAGALLPFFLPRRRGAAVVSVALFVVVILTCYAPFAAAGSRLFEGVRIYADKWRFNDSVFALVFEAVRSMIPQHRVVEAIRADRMTADAVTIASRTTDFALVYAKAIVGAAFLALYAALLVGFWRRRGKMAEDAPLVFAMPVLAALLLLAPTLHPWYVLWMLPFLTLRPNRAWILFTGTVVLSYWVLVGYVNEGVWRENPVVKWLEYLPFYLLLCYDAWRAFRSSPAFGPPTQTQPQNPVPYTTSTRL